MADAGSATHKTVAGVQHAVTMQDIIKVLLDIALITAPKACDPEPIKKLDAVAGRVLS